MFKIIHFIPQINLEKAMFFLVSLFVLSGCFSNYVQNTSGAYTTKQKTNTLPLFNMFTHYDVAHFGGPKLNSCLEPLRNIKSKKMNLTFLAPCDKARKIATIISSKYSNELTIIQSLTRQLAKVETFFDHFKKSKNAFYKIYIIIIPYGMTYHYQRTFLSFFNPTLYLGINLNSDKINPANFVSNAFVATIHEAFHYFDFNINTQESVISDYEFKLEYHAYLAEHCAMIRYSGYRKVKLFNYQYPTSKNFFLTIKNKNYSVVKNIKFIAKNSNNSVTRIKGTLADIVLVMLQRDLLKLTDSRLESSLDDMKLKRILKYCDSQLNEILG